MIQCYKIINLVHIILNYINIIIINMAHTIWYKLFFRFIVPLFRNTKQFIILG